jgi:hypothetical protein
MPRGFQRSIADTEAAYRSGLLIDQQKRSFISKPKLIEGENDEPEPHLVLYGADVTSARMNLFRRENNRCQKCKLVVTWAGEDGMVGEYNHIRHKPWNRCWCAANAELLCRRCHSAVHADRAPQFGKRETVEV